MMQLPTQADQEVLGSWEQTAGAVAARYIDETLLNGTGLHHDTRGDYNQVVLLDGFDTRPFRLPWLPGTVIFLVASGACHKKSVDLLKGHADEAVVPRGCLLRRVNANPFVGEPMEDPLIMAGFRGDRVSVWAVQGSIIGSDVEGLEHIFTQVTNCAAFGSIVTGDILGIPQADCENLLASNGLLGTVVGVGREIDLQGRFPEGSTRDAHRQDWLFTSQHQRMSLAEMSIYSDHVAAAEDADEDFFGHFS